MLNTKKAGLIGRVKMMVKQFSAEKVDGGILVKVQKGFEKDYLRNGFVYLEYRDDKQGRVKGEVSG